MSLDELHIRNFQSLRKVDLELGTFTVIVGPSSSGKSALMRACRALAANVRGSSVITRGQKAMAITGRTDTHIITLERSDKQSSYRISDDHGSELLYTKLNGEVPVAVTNVLRLDPSPGSINFAAQFDKPYLLDESGATIARQLGELTNVIQVFEAVRQANKIRSQASTKLKTRKADLEQIKTAVTTYKDLPERLKLLAEVDKLNELAKAQTSRIGRLETAMRTLRISERLLAKSAPPVVPSAEPLNKALNRYLDLQAKLNGLKAKQTRSKDADRQAAQLLLDSHDIHGQLQLVLKRAQVCPTCGQPTTGA
jgi:predicted ATP-dependent endonuclease of OLD family